MTAPDQPTAPDQLTAPTAPTSAADAEQALAGRIAEDAAAWLADARAAVAADPDRLATAFPQVSRRLGRGPLAPSGDPADPFTWTVDDAGRALLVDALPPDRRDADLIAAYRHGDARERRGALRALDTTPAPTATPVLVGDALRANDTTLVAAALGPAGVASLDDQALAHAVLKAVFVGLDLARIPGLAARTTPELSRMMADFVHERVAAGRDVPAEVWPVIDAHPPADRLAAIAAEVDSPDPHRATAARAALALRR